MDLKGREHDFHAYLGRWRGCAGGDVAGWHESWMCTIILVGAGVDRKSEGHRREDLRRHPSHPSPRLSSPERTQSSAPLCSLAPSPSSPPLLSPSYIHHHTFRKLTDLPSFFKTLIDHPITVELKNDIKITGTLKSVDQYLNIKLDDISVTDELRYPHLSAVKNVFIRGSVVRYVHLSSSSVDVTLLEDATRRGMYSLLNGSCVEWRRVGGGC